MSKMFTSLMRDSEGEKVTWAQEWEKATIAKNKLFAVVDGAPSVKLIVRKMLESELVQRRKKVDIDNVYINTGSLKADGKRRPSGTLSEVVLYCLDNNVQPGYVVGGDGVFYLADTFSDKFKVPEFSIHDVESLVSSLSGELENKLQEELAGYWAAAAKATAVESPLLTNTQIFHQAYASVLTAELSLSVMTGAVPDFLGGRFAHLLNAAKSQGAFEVRLQPDEDYLGGPGPRFVLDNAERAGSEMKWLNEDTGYVVHTPKYGFEYFSRSTELYKKLQARKASPTIEIKCLKMSGSVISNGVDAHLKGQVESAASRLRNRQNFAGTLISELQNNQNMQVMRHAIETRFNRLFADLKRTDWPLWLKSATQVVQKRYAELEESMERYDVIYKAEFDKCFSFKDYVLRSFAAWSDSALGEALDPEVIQVHSSYKLQVGGRTIEQEESRTLTEYLVVGLHDDGHRANITLKGTPPGSRLSVNALEQWLTNRSLRLEFVATLPASTSAGFQQAYRDYLNSQMEFALFVARNSGYYSEKEAEVVQRGLAGDPSVLIRGLKIKNQSVALKEVFVFMVAGIHNGFLLFLKTPEGKFQFQKFPEMYEMNRWLEAALSVDRNYAETLIHPEYLNDAGKLMGTDRAKVHYKYELDNRFADLFAGGMKLLSDYAPIAYRAEVALHKTIAPIGYRFLGDNGRKRYARLTTELKALSVVDARENGFPSFERFTYDLIKQEIEIILRSKGRVVDVNPDLIMVQTVEFRKSITDLLLEGISFEASHPAYATKDDPKYFVTGGHPVMAELDIRHLSALSKTFRPGDRYTEMLKKVYLDKGDAGYAFKRAVHAKKIRCQMHCSAVSDFIDGRISPEILAALQRVIDDLKESGGYLSIADNISEGDEGLYKFNIGPLGLMAASDRTVEGVYIFRLKLGAEFYDYLYTPDAPDRATFRPVGEFIQSIRFRYGPFRDYYSGRILLVDQAVINEYFDRIVATVDSRPPVKTQSRAKLPDLYTFHNERVRRVLSDIDERTTSLKEVVAGLIYDNVMKVANLISLVVPPIGTVVVAVQMMKSIYDASQADRRGDYSAAVGHLKDTVTSLLTLGKAAAAGAPVKAVTNAQRSFLSLFKDARTVAEFVTHVSGQKAPDEMLIGFFKSLLENSESGRSKTTVR
jgi:hypothetical protein